MLPDIARLGNESGGVRAATPSECLELRLRPSLYRLQ